IFFTEDWVNGCFRLYRVADEDLNTVIAFSEEDAPEMGEYGGVLFVQGEMWVLHRSAEYTDEGQAIVNDEDVKVYDMQGNLLRTFDPEPFGQILAVFADKYIIGGTRLPYDEFVDMEDTSFWDYDCTLYTLDGKKVMKHIHPSYGSFFCIEDESGDGQLASVQYIKDAEGRAYDGGLDPVDKLPGDLWRDDVDFRYECLNSDMDELGFRCVTWDPLYNGVKNADGEWLFRIYNPKTAQDRNYEYYPFD
ncbi:MAG: hypothetical protein II124_07460, partial [Clostridia bacterium]|nr:hypothetical protein [Clostridia bacterium]